MTCPKLPVLVFCLLLSFANAQAPEAVEANLGVMLEAVQSSSYEQFLGSTSTEFKETYSQESFDAVSEFYTERLAAGYDLSYLTTLNSNGYVVYLWKMTYQDGGDDGLVSLSISNGFVGGFLIQ